MKAERVALPRRQLLVLLAAGLVAPGWALAEERVVVTARQLIQRNHVLEVTPGTEVVWGDPHFERIWFAPGSGVAVRRTADGFAAVFAKEGEYHGRFTLVASAAHGSASADVLPLTVIVRGATK